MAHNLTANTCRLLPCRNDRFRVTAIRPGEPPVSVDIDLKDLLYFNQATQIRTGTQQMVADGMTISRLSSSPSSGPVFSSQPRDFGLSHDQNLIVSGLIESHKRKEELQSKSMSEKWINRIIAVASMVIACGSAYNALSNENHLQSLKRENRVLKDTVQVYNDTLIEVRTMCPHLSVESYITNHSDKGEEGASDEVVVSVRE
ncbi:hypothetical protein V866_006845 [Kwoniella sp. B9012]